MTDTIRLKPDTVLIALHPSLTQISLADNTPAYQGVGGPKALVQSAQGATRLFPASACLPAASSTRARLPLLWSAGENSLVDDVRFEGGHGGPALANGVRANPYNPVHSADGDSESSLGRPVSQPLGAWRWRDVQRHLEPEY